MIGFGADLILLALVAMSIGIYHRNRTAKDIKEYEDAFLREHIKHIPHKLLLLELGYYNREYFLKICGLITKWNVLEKHPPGVENHVLGFKEAVSHNFLVEMLRCTKSLAIIDAKGYYNCVYVLKRRKHDKKIDATIFNIYNKLCFYDEALDPDFVPLDGNAVFKENLQPPHQEGDYTSAQHLNHEVVGEPTMEFPERHHQIETYDEIRYQPDPPKPVFVPELEQNEYSPSRTNQFDRSQSVRHRRSSAMNRDIYHGNQLRPPPSFER